MTASVYQIQYSDNVAGSFDPAFLKCDYRDNPEPEKREIVHMLRFYDEGLWKRQGADHFGLVSPKFADKAGISGRAFIDWIEANPGYDVYFINPFPQLSYWCFNVWTQGEYWHPGLSELADALFAAAGYSIRVEQLPRNHASSLLFSNYWVGNEKFWHVFMTFVRQLVMAVDHLGAEDKRKMFAQAPHYTPATYFPFVFERLFSTFLLTHTDISGLSYPYSRNEVIRRCGSRMERFIVSEWADMIDAWDADGRDDVNYRKLFSNLHGMWEIYQSDVVAEAGHGSSVGGRRLLRKFMRTLGK